MNQWMNAAERGYIGCTLVAKSIKVGRRSRKLRTIGSWRTHTAEDAVIDSWWLQLQGNNEGQQRGLKQWLLRMLGCWWQMLAERHEEAAGSVDGGAAGAAENSLYTPRMACTRMMLRKVLDSQMENCIEAWRQQRLLPWASLLPPGEKRRMTV